jgi:hypothetical protein
MEGEAVRSVIVVELSSLTMVFTFVDIRWIAKGICRRKLEICRKLRIICLVCFIWVVRILSPTPVSYVAVITIVIFVKHQTSVVSIILSSQIEHTRLQREKE